MFSDAVGRLPGPFKPSLADEEKETQIAKLIEGLFINEEKVDQAFEIAKTMESSVTFHFMLSDVCYAYLKLGTESGCKRAYHVAQHKEKQQANVYKLFDAIIKACILLKTVESITLAEDIYTDNAKCLELSPNKNDFHRVKTQIEHSTKTNEQKNFNSLESSALESLRIQLGGFDALQKSKYFSSTMKFSSSWARGEEEMTPLQYACFLGNIEDVKLLIEQGASVNDFRDTSDTTQRSSLHFAIDAGHAPIALLLLSKGAKDRVASCDTFHALTKYRLPKEFGGSWTCLSALHMSIIKNWFEVTKALLNTGNAQIKVNASGNLSPLHLAARVGNEEMVKLLLSSGASVSDKDHCGKTAKEVALNEKHEHLLPLL